MNRFRIEQSMNYLVSARVSNPHVVAFVREDHGKALVRQIQQNCERASEFRQHNRCQTCICAVDCTVLHCETRIDAGEITNCLQNATGLGARICASVALRGPGMRNSRSTKKSPVVAKCSCTG